MDYAEVTKECVRANRCPKCAAKIFDGGNYLKCTECDWLLTHGCYDPSTGTYYNEGED